MERILVNLPEKGSKLTEGQDKTAILDNDEIAMTDKRNPKLNQG